MTSQPRILMCPPDHYGIEYEINPWMNRSLGAVRELSFRQWKNLRDTLLSLDVTVELLDPRPGLPDLVFTANAGLVFHDTFLSSRFKHEVRARESPIFDEWFEQHGFRVEKIDPVRFREFVVSSTRIRRLIAEGRVDEAAGLLGHLHFIDGRVVEGDGRGRRIGFPTANLATENELLPPMGVYATTATIGRRIYASITNIGVRPTFGDAGAPTIETHVFGLDRDLYGTTVRLGFVLRMRAERAFPDVAALTAQILADAQQAKGLFDRLSP